MRVVNRQLEVESGRNILSLFGGLMVAVCIKGSINRYFSNKGPFKVQLPRQRDELLPYQRYLLPYRRDLLIPRRKVNVITVISSLEA